MADRVPNQCTCCGEKLPSDKKGWGLNWNDGAGMCAKCLYLIRKSIGYFDRLEKKKKKRQVLD